MESLSWGEHRYSNNSNSRYRMTWGLLLMTHSRLKWNALSCYFSRITTSISFYIQFEVYGKVSSLAWQKSAKQASFPHTTNKLFCVGSSRWWTKRLIYNSDARAKHTFLSFFLARLRSFFRFLVAGTTLWKATCEILLWRQRKLPIRVGAMILFCPDSKKWLSML